MPAKSGMFTHQERRFVAQMAATGDPQYAAYAAGYSSPRSRAYQALARPDIQAAIVQEQTARLNNEALPLAVSTLMDVMSDKKVSASARVAACKVVIDNTLRSDDKPHEKEPHEMTAEELAQAIQDLQRKAADKAKPVVTLEADADSGVFG